MGRPIQYDHGFNKNIGCFTGYRRGRSLHPRRKLATLHAFWLSWRHRRRGDRVLCCFRLWYAYNGRWGITRSTKRYTPRHFDLARRCAHPLCYHVPRFNRDRPIWDPQQSCACCSSIYFAWPTLDCVHRLHCRRRWNRQRYASFSDGLRARLFCHEPRWLTSKLACENTSAISFPLSTNAYCWLNYGANCWILSN